ncbi:MAG: phosphoribosylglycinamide formyltransferase [Rhodoferax sp.]
MTSDTFNVIVCASGGGGNFQALIDSRSELEIDIRLLVVDRPCGAIERAVRHGIPYVILDSTKGRDAMFELFAQSVPANIDLVVLAGFMPVVPAYICQRWQGKIVNTHPSLLPKYGGKGMYGVKVQEAVMQAREEMAGCTVHFVNAGIDEGEIIVQKAIVIDYSETPWQLGGRIFKEENFLLVEAVKLLRANSKF